MATPKAWVALLYEYDSSRMCSSDLKLFPNSFVLNFTSWTETLSISETDGMQLIMTSLYYNYSRMEKLRFDGSMIITVRSRIHLHSKTYECILQLQIVFMNPNLGLWVMTCWTHNDPSRWFLNHPIVYSSVPKKVVSGWRKIEKLTLPHCSHYVAILQ